MASTITLQQVVNSVRAYPELTPTLGPGGWTQEPALSIANQVMQRMLATSLNWKFNRALVPSFLTNCLQQDYVTNVTDLSWLEQGWRVDINNTMNNAFGGAKPIRQMETVRDLSQGSYPGVPFQMSWIPNNLAVMGKWVANTAYQSPYGVAAPPSGPIQQFKDAHGNILFINSNSLGLDINSPGFSGTVIPTTPPYGTSGNVQPDAGANPTPGTTVVDGTVTWTVADPNGVAMRMVPIPAVGSLCWLIMPVYQKKPPILTSLQNVLSPIPDEMSYLFRQGFIALCYEHAGKKEFAEAYTQWQEMLMTALRSGDREREEATMYPSESIMGGGPYRYGMPVGPAWPFDYWGQ